MSLAASRSALPTAPTALDHALRAAKPALWTVVVFSFFINILGLTGSLYMMQVYDRVLASRNLQTLVLLTIIVAILYLVSAALEALRTQLRRLTRCSAPRCGGPRPAMCRRCGTWTRCANSSPARA
ncbi:MAG: hypothetical protein B7Z41_03495 [Rhizobiales bacterium 12-66-7]|nr:MAG: hypothetical protein B7Z41_03495 [Rhizobiales bacterium 12-66-7]